MTAGKYVGTALFVTLAVLYTAAVVSDMFLVFAAAGGW